MKKIVFTVAAITALTLGVTAQNDPKKKETKPKENKEAAVQPESATATKENGPGTKKTADEPKKSGTRMAINEKGLPGEKKSKQNTNNPK